MKSFSRRPRWLLRDLWTGGGITLLGLLCFGSSIAPLLAQEIEPLELNASWTDALVGQYDDTWFEALRQKPQRPLDVKNTAATGDHFLKERVLSGQRDFIVSGMRLNSEEKASANGKQFIELPVSATGFALVARAPVPSGWETEVPGVPDDEGQVTPVRTPYPGTINVRPSLIIDQLYRALNINGRPEFSADNGGYKFRQTSISTPILLRSEPGALSYHLQSYLRTFALSQWESILAGGAMPLDRHDEFWPVTGPESRALDPATVTAVISPTNPNGVASSGGHFALFTYGRFQSVKNSYPTVDLRAAGLKNAAGNFVTPTKESIAAGIDAGIRKTGGSIEFVPNAALTNPTLSNAYPLTWLNWMIVPASGLSADKANAVAAVARYLVSDGQTANTAFDEPVLPADLVEMAWTLADQIVVSNCSSGNVEVVTRTDAGPFAPGPLPTGKTIKFCQTKASVTTTATAATTTSTSTTTIAASTTTTTIAATTSPATTSAPFIPQPIVTRAPTAVPTTTTATTTTAATSTTLPPSTTLPGNNTAPTTTPTTLPLTPPFADRQQFDRFATMFVGGGGLFFGIRRLLRTRLSSRPL